MDIEKWRIFIDHFWTMVAYRQLLELYKKNALRGSFFQLTASAVEHEYLMVISHCVHECKEIGANFAIGGAAKATLQELDALYKRGDGERSKTEFPDCGLKVYRDKVAAHPANKIKAVLGNEPLKIDLKWNTVEQLFQLLKRFADEVEQHFLNDWQETTFKDEINGIDVDFNQIIWALATAKEFDDLKLAIIKKGKPRISYDWQEKKFNLED